MADRSFKVYIGEDLSPVIDLTDRIDWPNVEATMAAEAGEVGVGSVPVRDEAGSLSLPVRNRAEWVQGSNTLWRGRVQAVDYSRQIQVADRARHQSVTVDDYNIDLQGIPVDSFVRSSETDVARVQALVATALSGNPRSTTNLNGSNYVSSSNTVTLAAKTYSNTEPLDILREIALETDKEFFVDVDGNLHYDGHDSLAFVCPYYITDRPEEHDADPLHALTLIPNMGPVTSLEGQELSSHVRVYYTPDDYREAGNPTVETNHAYWMDTFHIEGITASQAQAIANTLSARRAFPGRSYAMTVGNANGGPLTDEQIGSIKAGMMIRIKARVTPDAPDAFLWRRIRELTWSTPAPGQHYAHLRLDKRLLTSPRPRQLAPQPPVAGNTASYVTGSDDFNNSSHADIVLTVNSGQSLIVFTTGENVTSVRWHYSSAPDIPASPYDDFVKLGEVGSDETEVWFLASPTAAASKWVRISVDDADKQIWSAHVVDCNETAPTIVTNTGTGTAVSTNTSAAASDLILDWIGWRENVGTPVASTPGASQTLRTSETFNASFGITDLEGSSSTAIGISAMTWTAATSVTWSHIVAVFTGTASDTTEPVGGSGSAGSGGVYAPLSHVHEARTIVRKNSTGSEFIRRRVNLIEGTGVTLTVADDSTDNEVDVTIAASSGTDQLAKVSSNDTTAGYLNGKLVAGSNVTLTENNDGGNETLTIAASGSGGSAAQSYLGKNAVGASTLTTTSRRVYVKKVTIPTGGAFLMAIEAYMQQNSSNVGTLRGVIYSDNAGNPDRALQLSNAQLQSVYMGPAASTAYRWIGVPMARWLDAGDYWIGIWGSGSTVAQQMAYDTSTGSDRYMTLGGDWTADWGAYTVVTPSPAEDYSIRAAILTL